MDADDFEFSDALNPELLMQRVADRALAVVPSAEGALVGLRDRDRVRFVCGAGTLARQVGTSVGLTSSLAGLAVRTGKLQFSADLSTDPHSDAAFSASIGVSSSVFVPVQRGPETLGVVTVCSGRKGAFSPVDVALLAQLAEFLGIAVGFAGDLARARDKLAALRAGSPAGTTQEGGKGPGGSGRFLLSLLHPESVPWVEAKARVQEVLDDPHRLSMVFQPIIDVEGGSAISVEALARFAAEPVRSPDLWFNEAHAAGLGVELETVAVSKAVALLPSLPAEVAMTVNVGPAMLSSDGLLRLLGGVEPERVVLELTEHSGVDDYPRLRSAVQALRKRGVRLAVDDTGAGISSLAHILKLAPDFIKLDRELVKGVDVDPVRRALASALLSFGAETGASVIAEGVETAAELKVLRQAGVRYVQGYYFGRPSGLSSLSWDRPAVAASCKRPSA